MSYSLIGTSSFHDNRTKGEIAVSRPTKCMFNLSKKTKNKKGVSYATYPRMHNHECKII